MKTKMTRLLGLLVPASLAVFLFLSCNLNLADAPGTVRLDLASMSRNLFRSLDSNPDGAVVSTLRITLADSVGELVIDQTFTSPASASTQTILKRGESYFLNVEATITPGHGNAATRTWTNSQELTVPTTGTSLDLVVSITRVTFPTPTLSLVTGSSHDLLPTVVTSNEVPPGLVWASSDPSIITVDNFGTVTAVGTGTADITVYPDDNGFGSSVTVTTAGAFSVSVNFSDPAQPDMTFTGSQTITINPASSMTVSVPAGYDTYAWYVNGTLAAGSTTNSLTLTGNDPALKPGTINRLLAVVTQAGKIFSSDMPFTVTSPFPAGGDGVAPYIVTTAAELDMVRLYPSKNFVLGNDITLSAPWTPIAGFTGKFYGQQFAIKGLNVTGSGSIGLFADLSGTAAAPVEIEGINIPDATVTGSGTGSSAGIIAGTSTYATISKCVVNGTVSVTDGIAGSLAGTVENTWIESCAADYGINNSVTSGNGSAGGLVGKIVGSAFLANKSGQDLGSLVIKSWSTARVTAGTYAGGIAGWVYNNGYPVGISEVYSQGSVVSMGSDGYGYAGGLVGYIQDSTVPAPTLPWFYMENSYSTANVDAWNASGTAGGLFGGAVNTKMNVRYSYAFNTVNAVVNNTGGIVGSLDATTLANAVSGSFSSCYWNKERSGLSYALGMGSGNLSTGVSMQYFSSNMAVSSNFSGWSFGGVWQIVTGETAPFLNWQNNVNYPWLWTLKPNLVSNPGYSSAGVASSTGWSLYPSVPVWASPAGHTDSFAVAGSGTSAACYKTQTIDLAAAGHTPALLAGTNVVIHAGEWINHQNASTGTSRYSFTMNIMDSSNTILATVTTGEMKVTTTQWGEAGLTFTNSTGLSNIAKVQLVSASWSDSGTNMDSTVIDETNLVVIR